MIPVLRLLIFLAAFPALANDECPDGAERVATTWPGRPWVCALVDGPEEDDGCPEGSQEVTVASEPRPFRCALDGADPKPPTGCPKGEVSSTDAAGRLKCLPEGAPPPPAAAGSRCPEGFEPVFTKGSKKGLRCVKAGRPEADSVGGGAPAAAAKRHGTCPPGTQRMKTENPFEPVRCAPAEEAGLPPVKDVAAKRFEVPGELRLEHPENWRLTDAWKDDVPSLYIQLDLARDGKPVVMTVLKYRRNGKVYVDMDASIRQELDWRAAREGGKGVVAGLPARFIEVPRESKLAYLRTGDGYYVLGYSAPEDLYAVYAPVFARLLKSLRIVHSDRDPLPEEDRP